MERIYTYTTKTGITVTLYKWHDSHYEIISLIKSGRADNFGDANRLYNSIIAEIEKVR